MMAMRQAVAVLALAVAARGAPDPGEVLAPGGLPGDWKALVAALAAKGPIEASFTERRYFPFRHEPTVLKGVLRISPERGLSLQYTDPEPSVLIADSAGLVLRDQGGSREMASGSREAGAIASLLPIMRFDLPALFPRFVIRARRTDADWSFEFTPRNADSAGSLGSITVLGAGTDVRQLEFRRSASQRVEIEVGETRAGVVFTAAELARYFR
jgi:hypothetical protein